MTQRERVTICRNCTHESYCDTAQFGQQEPPITACYKFKKKHRTNADKYFRNATDEDIADILYDIEECDRRCPAKTGDCIFSDSKCRSALLKWLKQEVDK